MTTQNMRQSFAEQTGQAGDAMEYANPARSQVETMFYTGTDPWHRIGTKLDNPATAEEAIEAAGLAWNVTLQPTYIYRPGVDAYGNRRTDIPVQTGRSAVVREDTGKVFGVFSPKYTPLQNSAAFTFFDAVVGAGAAIYETAGSLKGGSRIWILASLPGDVGLDGDGIKRYVMLSNSHDGSSAIDMRFCARRVVCWNTFKMALTNGSENVRIRHVGDVLSKVNSTREILGLADAYFHNFMEGVEKLTATSVPDNQAQAYFDSVVGVQHDAPNPQVTRINAASSMMALYKGEGMGSSLPTAYGTAWGAFNAVSEQLEHRRWANGYGGDVALQTERRLSSSFFGSGAGVEQHAWSLALNLAL